MRTLLGWIVLIAGVAAHHPHLKHQLFDWPEDFDQPACPFAQESRKKSQGAILDNHFHEKRCATESILKGLHTDVALYPTSGR